MTSLFGKEQVVEIGEINQNVFDNFGNGLAKLLGKNTIDLQSKLQQPQQQPQLQPQLQTQQNNLKLEKNENLTFNIKKK